MVIRLFFLTLLGISTTVIAKNTVVYYEPRVAILKGMVRLLEFAGEPNYESIKNGDSDETGPFLILGKPINTISPPEVSIEINEEEKNVKFIQIIRPYNLKLPELEDGYYIQITGTLFRAHTGHHHSRVLMMTDSIKVIAKKKLLSNKLDLTPEDNEFLSWQNLPN